jgi:myosin heavy subunit
LVDRFKASVRRLFAEVVGVSSKRPFGVSYVACVRPNDSKAPDHFSNQAVVRQLRALGIVPAARMATHKASYPHRLDHGSFVSRFVACLLLPEDVPEVLQGASVPWGSETVRNGVASVLARLLPAFAPPLQYYKVCGGVSCFFVVVLRRQDVCLFIPEEDR